jgi:hypothetical protein
LLQIGRRQLAMCSVQVVARGGAAERDIPHQRG